MKPKDNPPKKSHLLIILLSILFLLSGAFVMDTTSHVASGIALITIGVTIFVFGMPFIMPD